MPPSLASALMECLLRTWRSWKISCLADVDNGEGLTHFVVVTCLVARSLEACVHTYTLGITRHADNTVFAALHRFLPCMESYRKDLFEIVHERSSEPYDQLRDIWRATKAEVRYTLVRETIQEQGMKKGDDISSVETVLASTRTQSINVSGEWDFS